MCECERGIEARGRRVEGRRWERRVSRGGGMLWVVWVRYRGRSCGDAEAEELE